jgi:hypothetical protein
LLHQAISVRWTRVGSAERLHSLDVYSTGLRECTSESAEQDLRFGVSPESDEIAVVTPNAVVRIRLDTGRKIDAKEAPAWLTPTHVAVDGNRPAVVSPDGKWEAKTDLFGGVQLRAR